jgi:uncharacterized membrane protein
MSLALLLHSGLNFLILRLAHFLVNHLVNIPLSLILGTGKYIAFWIALVMDIGQIIIYHNVLNKTKLGKRFGWAVDKKLQTDYKKPKFITRLPHSWSYIGVMLLSLLPVYFGGLFAAVFTSHLLKLKKLPSYIFIGIGSLIGCFIWTIGIWNLIELGISFFHKIT